MVRMSRFLGSAALVASMTGAGLGSAMAQTSSQADQAQNQAQTAPSATQSTTATGAGSQSGNQQAGSAEQSDEDHLIAMVNDVEIRQSDVASAIENLPPQVRQVPQQMLVPVVVDQLLARELIAAQARSENLQSDPAVVAVVEEQTRTLEDQALVNVWIERELAESITEARINEAYERFKAANPESTVTLEDARPQLEQALRQETAQQLVADLREGAAIVFYDASGNPVQETETSSTTGQNQQTGQN